LITASSSPDSVPFPPPVRAGDRVGVAALSGPVDPVRLASGVEGLRALGFEPVLARNLGFHSGLFAGSDQERLDAFHELAADSSLTAIFFARGGHGLLRVLPALDWRLLAAHPRAYIGYSDLTPFLHQVVVRLGWVAFHGPMVAVELARGLSAAESEQLMRSLAGDAGLELPFASGLRSGRSEGRLLGGCLSMIAATLGTPWQLDLDGGILFWEDVGEPPYRLDRMLTHLVLSGSLARIAGVVAGPCPCVAPEDQSLDWLDPLLDASRHHSGPVAWGLPSGHCTPNLTLPLGRPAVLEVRAGEAGRLLIG
jgi:muramoyltetrapeptide carboxypeptidase